MLKTRLVLSLLLAMAAHAAAQTAPALSPTAGSTNICPDTPIHITFNAPPSLGAGTIEIHDASDDSLLDSFPVNPPPAAARAGRGTAVNAPAPVQITPGVSAAESFGKTLAPAGPPMPTRARLVGGTSYTYYPLAITGNTLTIYPAALLPYDKTITIKIPQGAFQVGGQPSAAISLKFTTKTAAPMLPATGPRRVTIAADGSGDFCTLQAALDFIPQGNTTPTTLFIKNGVYNELINFSGRNNLTLLGQDRKKTILAYADNDAFSNSPPQIPAPPVAAAPAAGRGRGGGGYRRGS
ncbi:MAG TPA: pectinesterase family protein, partial [Phycisphaerae bacterium]